MYEIQLNPFIFPAILSLFLLWSITKWVSESSRSKNLRPPSPPKLPILGNLHQLGSLPHQNLQSLARKHGPLMLLRFGKVPVLVASSADAASEIIKANDVAFASRPQYKVFKKLLYNCKNITFSPYGDYWRQVRSIFVLHLLSNKRVQSYRSIREEETALFMKKIGESSGPVNLSEMFSEFANDLICRSAFGVNYRESEKGKKILRLLEEAMEVLGVVSVGDFIPWLGWIDRVNGYDKKLNRIAMEMDGFLEDVIQENVRNPEVKNGGENFVDILLDIHNQNIGGLSIERDGIKGLLVDTLAGGTDTISTALEWTMTELLRHPRTMEILKNEVRDIVKDKRNISDDDIKKMHYLKAVIKETLRHHPPVPLLVPRVARNDVRIKGYDVSKGTVVMINAWAIGRDQVSWDEPEKFQPERFSDSAIDLKGLNFELIPFGAGRRGCPGMSYGIATIEFLLANVVQKFNWKLEGKEVDTRERPGITISRLVPLLAVATKTT